MPAAPTTPLLDDQAILDACRAATVHRHGRPVLDTAHPAHGVRVWLSNRPRQQEALTALRALGYAATDDSRPVGADDGEALLVTGWDEQSLAARVERLERAVHELEAEHDAIAAHTLDWYRRYAGDAGLDEADARRRTLDDVRRAARPPGRTRQHLSVAPPTGDIRQATGLVRELLVRVTAAETALAKLCREHLATSEAAIDLFVEYRDCYGYDDHDQAAAKALTDVREGVQAVHELAGYDSDPDWRFVGADLLRATPSSARR